MEDAQKYLCDGKCRGLKHSLDHWGAPRGLDALQVFQEQVALYWCALRGEYSGFSQGQPLLYAG